ncbi:hypothetical protein ACHAXR_011133 [Thalassiosira sp. AJA248-18]
METPEVRSERVVMTFEAFAIFGSLFLNGTWILYEYGSAKGVYPGHGTSEAINDAFEGVMAFDPACNTFMALLASAWWIQSVISCGSKQYVIESLRVMEILKYLLWGTTVSAMLGLMLAIYSNMYPQWPWIISLLSMLGALYVYVFWFWVNGEVLRKGIPLTFYHYPLWYRLILSHPLGGHRYAYGKGKEDLLTRAKQNAEELRQKAHYQRHDKSGHMQYDDIFSLLRNAADNLGETDYDTSAVEKRLREDMIKRMRQLEYMDVKGLPRYMPYGLAHEAHNLIQTGIGH